MPKIESKDWYAAENRFPPYDPSAVPFYVTGKVITGNSAIQPVLKEAVPQGINPDILILDLTLEQVGDNGTTDMNFRDARFEETVKEGQYSSVTIRYSGNDIESISVEITQ